MSLSYNNSILAQNISVSGSNTNVSGVLQVNNVNVSISGHTHTASQISDFASAVSGYFPPSGSQGVQGAQGVTGSNGSQGSQGTQGITGSTGSQGSQGTQGVTGNTGSQGVQGAQGITGSNGGQGSQGTQGITGSTGSQGVQGTQGVTGSNGSQGSQGTQGVTGSQGTQGIQGGYTNIVGGTGISIASGNGIATINMYAYAIRGYEVLSSGKTLFSVSGGYLVDNLSVYYNGYKLLGGDDFTATNGTTFTLNSTTTSGDIVEWVGLGGPPTATFIQGLQGTQGSAGPSAGSANQIIYKNTSDNTSGNSNLIFNDSTNTMTISGILISTSGSFTNNLAIGSNNLTPTNTLNIINSSNLYLWANFR